MQQGLSHVSRVDLTGCRRSRGGTCRPRHVASSVAASAARLPNLFAHLLARRFCLLLRASLRGSKAPQLGRPLPLSENYRRTLPLPPLPPRGRAHVQRHEQGCLKRLHEPPPMLVLPALLWPLPLPALLQHDAWLSSTAGPATRPRPVGEAHQAGGHLRRRHLAAAGTPPATEHPAVGSGQPRAEAGCRAAEGAGAAAAAAAGAAPALCRARAGR